MDRTWKEWEAARAAGELPTREEIRQICDVRFSEELHQKLRQAKVAVAGLGGLGSNIAVMLARSGIGRLRLIDFDRVDLSNLNRQVYDIRHLGQKKTEALSWRLRELNPYIELEAFDVRVTEENARELLYGWNYICEAFDDPAAKAMLAEQVLCGNEGGEDRRPEESGEKPWTPYLVAASGMAGYSDADRIRTRKINSRFYVCGDEETDAAEGIGLMAPRVAVCAGHQANKIIQLILGE